LLLPPLNSGSFVAFFREIDVVRVEKTCSSEKNRIFERGDAGSREEKRVQSKDSARF
jgi:hypothetical protein